MSAIKFGCDLHVQFQRLPSRFHSCRVGNSSQKIATQANEASYLTGQNAFTGVDSAQSQLLRHLETEMLLDQLGGHFLRVFGNTYGALTLDVRVAPYRADTGTGLANVSAHQQ